MLSKNILHSLSVFFCCFLLISVILFIPHGTVASNVVDFRKDANGGENGQSKSGVRGSHSPSAPSATTQSSPHSDTYKSSRSISYSSLSAVNCDRAKALFRSCIRRTPGRRGAPNKKSST
ncbi:hypothetical protein OWV82_016776 [Melia azedarach]|uniref:Uncharacterized protein n=1 Tax=Melia azedarach TaxID=155640 RepID=A0ACC1XI36_MELAZ|nr:hypothetical protein OWV82_016776 [Melia azedarach]